nr:MAG TPA: hypothetical protein [Caudoviricetes sp.]
MCNFPLLKLHTNPNITFTFSQKKRYRSLVSLFYFLKLYTHSYR